MSRLDTDMDRDDAGKKIKIAHTFKAGSLHHYFERFLVRMDAD